MPARISTEEPAMRDLLVPHLRERWPTGRVIHEFPLRYSTRRLDLAVVTADKIIGIEIKSSKDTLDRLAGQLSGFANVVHSFLVALAPVWNEQRPLKRRETKYGACWENDYTPAQKIVHESRGAGYTEIYDCCAGQKLLKRTKETYRENIPHPHRLLALLHVAELKRIAMRVGIGVDSRHDKIVKKLFDEMPSKQIVAEVCRQLRWRDAFCPGTDAPVFDTEKAGMVLV